MKTVTGIYGISIIAYCLLSNHYHFLVRQNGERPVSDWLKTLFCGYVQAVNKQRNRHGTLFEGRARHKVIESDEYLDYLLCYIHLNPVRAGVVEKPEQWVYSNFRECIGKRNGKLYDRKFIDDRYGSRAGYYIFFQEYCLNSSLVEKLEDYVFQA